MKIQLGLDAFAAVTELDRRPHRKILAGTKTEGTILCPPSLSERLQKLHLLNHVWFGLPKEKARQAKQSGAEQQ
jgi:hypothetical protein